MTDHVLDLSDEGRPSPLRPELIEVLRESLAQRSPECSCVVLIGAEQAFGYGADLKFLSKAEPSDIRNYFLSIEDLRASIEALDVPTLAVLDGPAFGASADLALACDLRIGSSATFFRFPGGRLGLVLGSSRLADIVGPVRATEFQITGRTISAFEAAAVGLLTELVRPEDMLSRVDEWIAELGAVPTGFVPLLREAVAIGPRGRDPRASLRASLEDLDVMAERIRAYAKTILR